MCSLGSLAMKPTLTVTSLHVLPCLLNAVSLLKMYLKSNPVNNVSIKQILQVSGLISDDRNILNN